MSSDRLAACLLGQALGDALGFIVEAESPQIAGDFVERWLRTGRASERAPHGFRFGQYSDDTQLARELVRSFLEARHWSPPGFAARIAALFREGKAVGAGEGTSGAARRLIDGVPWEESGTPAPYAGNGSAMRAAPLGILISDREAMCRAAREQSLITHRDQRCSAGAIIVARAVALAAGAGTIGRAEFLADLAACAAVEHGSVATAVLQSQEWMSLEPLAAARYVHECGLDPAHRERWQGISAFVIPSVLWSVYSFLRSPDDYWETICTAIAVGGDTDSMAAMAGAISGARVGPDALPAELVARVHDRGEWGAADLATLAHKALYFPA